MKDFVSKTRIMAYFCIVGEDFNPESITRKLLLAPTESWMKGDSIPDRNGVISSNRNRVRTYSRWEIGTDYEESLDIMDQLEKVLILIDGKEDVLSELKFKYELEYGFMIVIFIDKITPAMCLDKEIIKKIAKLNARIDFDTYV